MRNKRVLISSLFVMLFVFFFSSAITYSASEQFKGKIYDPGMLKPVDSRTKLKAGMPAPSFTLPSLTGEKISLAHYRGKKNVVLSFIPAAWTPVCSDQWPGYNILKDVFDKNDAVLLGITVDNLPTLNAWTKEMGELWFPVLSDFWPKVVGIAVGNTAGEIQQYNKEFKVSYPVLSDYSFAVHKALGNVRVPFTIFVKRDVRGQYVVVATHQGVYDSAEEVMKTLQAVLR